MDLPSAGQLANRLLEAHGLTEAGWTFAFNRRRRSLGLCRFDLKRIEISAPFTVLNPEAEVRNTLLHEIAHALTPPPRRGRAHGDNAWTAHGPAWRATCLRIGADPARLNLTAAAPPGRYHATCPRCSKSHRRYRKPLANRTYFCRACGQDHGALTFKAIRSAKPSAQS